ncbi:hypothetical protein Tco_0941940 [Tanacetum coccineum]|uniref:Uncharacterized protein n=1 Tax=Tanacetum coccineum TaxID=301880 RepID=A0ABQ5DSA0_9ASTR
MFDKAYKQVNDFVPMDTKSNRKKAVSKKRAGERPSKESAKRQKIDGDAEKAELKACLEIIPEDKMYYQIIRADGRTKYYKIFSAMLDDFDRQDVLDLYRLVKERFKSTSPEGYDRYFGEISSIYLNQNDPRDFAKSIKAIAWPQDVPSTSDCHLIELENHVQHLMESHLPSTQPTQVNKITTLYELCSGPHDTQYCMKYPEQDFVEYASLRTDEVRGLVSNFMASQDTRLSKFEADFKQQQSEMTNKIDIVLKAITDRIAGTLPSNTVKNPKLSTSSFLSARSYPTKEPQCSTHIHGSINTNTIHPKQQNDSRDSMAEEEEQEREGNPKDSNTIAYIKER